MRRFIWIYPCLVLAIAGGSFPLTGCSSAPEPTASPPTDTAPSGSLQIAEPADGAQVGAEMPIQGSASPEQKVWLIVHPQETSDYWVQPPAIADDAGAWKTAIFVGRPGSADVGQRYEVRAVANPQTPLKEGQVLKTWPEAQATSSILKVTRR